LYAGQSAGDGSHSFVCDGYDNSDMFHFNWGYSGDFNGYFELTNLNPGTLNYTEMQAAGFDIKPGPESVNELSSEVNLSIYPNPANNSVNIGLDEGFEQVVIIDVTGKILTKETFEHAIKQTSLDISGLASGVYFVEVSSAKQTFVKKVLVK